MSWSWTFRAALMHCLEVNDMPRQMKDSGIDWIGVIPDDWTISRIKYVADFEPKCDTSELKLATEISYAPMECIKNGSYESRTAKFGDLAASLTPFENGDIVMAKVTPCFENGNIAIMDGLASGFGLGSSELFVFRPKKIETRYLFYWLQNLAFVNKACATMTGTGGLKRVSPGFVKNCAIHLPPINEQQTIASFLDRQCSHLDFVLEQTRNSIEEYKKLKQALITKAVTKGVRGERTEKSSEHEWIGSAPVEWQIIKIKWLLEERKERSESGEEEPLSMSQKYGLIPTKEMEVIPNMAWNQNRFCVNRFFSDTFPK